MRLNALGSKDRISRREFLKIVRLKDHVRPFIDKEKCTGCGICENKCPVDGEAAIVVYASGVQKKLKPEDVNNNKNEVPPSPAKKEKTS